MATAGGSAPAIVMKGNAGAAEHDGGLALAGPIRADVHALEKLLAKATGDAKEKLTEQVTELYLKVKGYSLADARPGAQTQLVAETKAVLAEAKKAFPALA